MDKVALVMKQFQGNENSALKHVVNAVKTEKEEKSNTKEIAPNTEEMNNSTMEEESSTSNTEDKEKSNQQEK